MEKVKRFAAKHKKWIAFGLSFVVVASVALVLLGSGRSQAATGAPDTTTLARYDLQQVVTATGTVQSTAARDVTSSLTYEITEVLVAVGDTVQKDQELLRLDTSDLEKSISDTKKSISTAAAQDQLKLDQANRKVQDAITTRDLNWAKNEQAVQEALGKLNDAVTVQNDAAYTLNVAIGAVAGCGYESYEAAEAADPPLAAGELQGIKALFDQMAAAQKAYDDATTVVAAAQSTYDKAVETRDTAWRNDTISIENAQDAVNTQKLSDSTQSLRTQLESYEKQLQGAKVTAPISGTVTAAGAVVGNAAGGSVSAGSGGSLFTIEDLTSLEIPAYVPEYDITQLSVGMQADITTDALDGEAWTGSITSLSPTAADANGNFLVTIKVTSPLGALAVGMSSKLNIVTEEKTNIFAVPYDALTTSDKGETVVVAWDGGAASDDVAARREIVVSTGMDTDYYIEIISDELVDGLEILNDPEGKNVSTDAATGGMFGMGG